MLSVWNKVVQRYLSFVRPCVREKQSRSRGGRKGVSLTNKQSTMSLGLSLVCLFEDPEMFLREFHCES